MAAGLTSDVITALAKHRWLRVLSRPTSSSYGDRADAVAQLREDLGVDYAVEGTLRLSDDRFRVTVSLTDATSGTCRWAERYDGRFEDLFDVLDDITDVVVATIEPEVGLAERDRVRRRPRTNLHAWDRFHLGMGAVDELPAVAVESFAGVANPFALRQLERGERVVDVGSGAGFDSFLAAKAVGPTGSVVGVDMTPQMLTKAQQTAEHLGIDHIEFREGIAEDLPLADGWADVVISNGVFNLCPDKRAVFDEVLRVLRPGGTLQFADIANGLEVPEEAVREIDLWTG